MRRIALVLACGLALAWVGQVSAQTVARPRHSGLNACNTYGGGGTTVVTTGSQCPPQPCAPPPCASPGGSYSNPAGFFNTVGYPYGGNRYGQDRWTSIRRQVSNGLLLKASEGFDLGGLKIRLVRGR